MKLAQYVQVNTQYTRSINIERDHDAAGTVRPYIPTTRALQTLDRIADTLHTRAAPRAWALVGPYGSGKSAFGLFLANLLGSSDKVATRAARKTLAGSDAKLLKKFQSKIGNSKGYCIVTLTGNPEPLTQRLAKALLLSAETFLAGRRGATPSFIKELRAAVNKPEISVGNLVDWLSDMQKAVLRADGRGVLLVIDELGKFLEYEARHRQSTDIHLLQALAEHASDTNEAPLQLVVLLHQSFEQYFSNLGDQLKNEWKKVQGRFESIPFLESAEQVLRVVRSAIIPSLPKPLETKVSKATDRVARVLKEQNALPQGMDLSTAKSLFTGTYPLHPVSLLVLPTLCQKVAQNERTLFSYLGSAEPHGLQESLTRLEFDDKNPSWVMPWEIFEYFILNQPGLKSDQITHRRWAEVITAVERLGDAPEPAIRLLKTIGLMNIASAQGGFRASKELLSLCYEATGYEQTLSFDAAIEQLLQCSVITYRRYNGEFRVWQGSDFDLESALQQQREQVGRIELAKLLNEREAIAPVVARRHAIETGTLRYFRPMFVDSVKRIDTQKLKEPTLLLCMAETREQEDQYAESLRGLHGYTHLIGVVVVNASLIRQAVTEVIAFERVQRHSPEIGSDPVASREIKDRLAVAAEAERDLLGAILEEPGTTKWWWNGADHDIPSKRNIQTLLSRALEETFHKSPHIHSELINRDRPSSTANAARNKLLQAMLEDSAKEDLGFEKFPAEKAIYRSLLRSTGIHAFCGDGWRFQAPTAEKANLWPTWQAIESFLDSTEGAPRPVIELFELLCQAPYGLKRGLLPILFLATYQAYSDEIALYEGGYYTPFMSQELMERIIKEPSAFSIQRFKIDHIRDYLYRSYIEVISQSEKLPEQVNLIAAAKPLAKFMMGLPDYTKHTRRISTEAQSMREKFFESKSPLQLLFFQIPEALGFRPLVGVETDSSLLHSFKLKLSSAASELRAAYHALLHEVQEQLKATFFLDKNLALDEMRGLIRGRFTGLQDYTIDVQGLKAFIGRLTDPYGDEKQWLISLASFLARKPPEKWSDDDASAVEYRLLEFAKRIRDIETLRVYGERRSDRTETLEVMLLKTISQQRGETEVLVTIDARKRAYLEEIKAKMQEQLSGLPNNDLAKALLAILVEEQAAGEERGGDGYASNKEPTKRVEKQK